MKLYNLAAGMNPRRVRIFLAEKAVDIEIVDIDMLKNENQTDAFLAKNPMGKLPVLELDDGTCVAESMAICRYIEELHPSPPLLGTTALERARIEMWNRRMELEILLPVGGGVFRHGHPFWADRLEQIPAYASQCRDQVRTRMAWLNDELAGRQFIAGDQYTVADITAQCAFIVAKACKLRIPDELAHLGRWFEQVSARPTSRA
ncbi:MAG: glutathione S-transferase family protein [Burkholderiaceae bacterium]